MHRCRCPSLTPASVCSCPLSASFSFSKLLIRTAYFFGTLLYPNSFHRGRSQVRATLVGENPDLSLSVQYHAYIFASRNRSQFKEGPRSSQQRPDSRTIKLEGMKSDIATPQTHSLEGGPDLSPMMVQIARV